MGIKCILTRSQLGDKHNYPSEELRTGLVVDVTCILQNAVQLIFSEIVCRAPAIALEIDSSLGGKDNPSASNKLRIFPCWPNAQLPDNSPLLLMTRWQAPLRRFVHKPANHARTTRVADCFG